MRAEHQSIDAPVGCRQPKGRATVWLGLRAVCRQPLANPPPGGLPQRVVPCLGVGVIDPVAWRHLARPCSPTSIVTPAPDLRPMRPRAHPSQAAPVTPVSPAPGSSILVGSFRRGMVPGAVRSTTYTDSCSASSSGDSDRLLFKKITCMHVVGSSYYSYEASRLWRISARLPGNLR